MYLEKTRTFLESHNGEDLYHILFEILNNKVYSFIELLDKFSKGESVSDMRNCVIILDWDEPEDYGYISLSLYEQLMNDIPVKDFVSCLEYIGQKYLSEYPDDTKIIHNYILSIKKRYESYL